MGLFWFRKIFRRNASISAGRNWIYNIILDDFCESNYYADVYVKRL